MTALQYIGIMIILYCFHLIRISKLNQALRITVDLALCVLNGLKHQGRTVAELHEEIRHLKTLLPPHLKEKQ